MHIPGKWRILVLLLVALAVGGYYVFVVRSERVGEWDVHQGSGQLVDDPETGAAVLDVDYTVLERTKPVFTYLALSPPQAENVPVEVVLSYRSQQRAALTMTLAEDDGSVYQARLALEPTETWARLTLDRAQFELRGSPENTDENARLDFSRIKPRVAFYDDSSVQSAASPFSNRVRLTEPRFETLPAKPAPEKKDE